MVFNELIVGLLSVASCFFLGAVADSNILNVHSFTTVKDGNNQVVSNTNFTMIASNYNHTRDSAMVNKFVQNQITKLQKTPELMFAERDTFGRMRQPPPPPPPPHRPPGPPFDYHWFELRTSFDYSDHNAITTTFLYIRIEVHARKTRGQEALFSLRAPTF